MLEVETCRHSQRMNVHDLSLVKYQSQHVFWTCISKQIGDLLLSLAKKKNNAHINEHMNVHSQTKFKFVF